MKNCHTFNTLEFLIIFGTLVLYSKKITLSEILKSFKVLAINNSAKLMIVVSLIWSLTPVLDKLCLEIVQ